ncbi:MAG: PepSY domain-containing protein [Allosphingosinicella sp.]
MALSCAFGGQALAAAGEASPAAADPALDIRRVQFPSEDRAAFKFEGQKAALLVRDRANAVWTSAADGAALMVADGRDLDVHQRISEAADPLHFGIFGGYWTKVPWFLFGLLLTGLSVSGVALYGMRIAGTKHMRRTGWSIALRAWRGMGLWRWPSLLLILAGFALLPSVFANG